MKKTETNDWVEEKVGQPRFTDKLACLHIDKRLPPRETLADDSRIRKNHAPENFALIRHMALNLLRQETSAQGGVKAKRLKAGWDNDFLAQVLAT